VGMVYAKDLAQAVVACLTHPAAAQRTYYAASPDVLHGEATKLATLYGGARLAGGWAAPSGAGRGAGAAACPDGVSGTIGTSSGPTDATSVRAAIAAITPGVAVTESPLKIQNETPAATLPRVRSPSR